ncbi:MAG: hypothetical protein FWB86_06315 [Treponema sp.]|nr:hypothetical protein [Treponema sp.]MCL2251861.1 hypothetical protein [Treponema sp.]
MTQKLFFILIIILIIPCLAYSQQEEISFNFGNINFSLTPKVMEDGSITDILFDVIYNNKLSGEYRFRNTMISYNEEFPDYFDSLNAVNEKTYELFILPAGYRFKNRNITFWAGGGIYYEYNKLNEKGFFDYPELEDFDYARLNSFTNDFSMHVLGPLIDIKFYITINFIDICLQGGIVPFFFLNAQENFNINPLFDSKIVHSQDTWGSPYFYLSLDTILFKYFNLNFHYNFSRINYDKIDYDYDLNNNYEIIYLFPETTVIGHSFNIEASALLPLGKDILFQIGYGFNFNTLIINNTEIKNNKQYLILGTRKSSRKFL